MNVWDARTNPPELAGGAVVRENLEKAESLRPFEDGRTLGQLALRYVLNYPAVSVAIPGAKVPAQVEATAASSVRPLLSEEGLWLIQVVAPL
jgi:myo-inositol catabolism protein IolS